MEELLDFLARLRTEGIHFTLEHIRCESVLVFVVVPGQRWEVEFMDDGSIQVEVFESAGRILDRSALERLFATFGRTAEASRDRTGPAPGA